MSQESDLSYSEHHHGIITPPCDLIVTCHDEKHSSCGIWCDIKCGIRSALQTIKQRGQTWQVIAMGINNRFLDRESFVCLRNDSSIGSTHVLTLKM